VAPSIREVARALLEHVDEMTKTVVEEYRQRIPEYPRLLQKHHEDLPAVARMAIQLFLDLVIEKRVATGKELSRIRHAGRARAAQGIALESMLQAYSIAREVAPPKSSLASSTTSPRSAARATRRSPSASASPAGRRA
jgi:hypothetical protein